MKEYFQHRILSAQALGHSSTPLPAGAISFANLSWLGALFPNGDCLELKQYKPFRYSFDEWDWVSGHRIRPHPLHIDPQQRFSYRRKEEFPEVGRRCIIMSTYYDQ
jgi:hypothetical protein